MRNRRRSASLALALALLLILPTNVYAAGPLFGANPTAATPADKTPGQLGHISQQEREMAAARMELAQRLAELDGGSSAAMPEHMHPQPGGVPDYFGSPNWAFSPPLRKFVDTLPGLGPDNANNLGQYIPVGHPDTVTYPGSDYYEIELVQYKEQLHSDLPGGTTLRGYRQVNLGTDGSGNNTIAPDEDPHHLGPFIIARKDRPVRIKFTNKLPTDEGGNLFLPVDKTAMGAGMGPLMHEPGVDASGNPLPMYYSENRGTLHLHGGITPWISDGTPHQWITPADEKTAYPKGVSVKNVPDMPDPGPGSMTFFYTNQQSARLMFYHDHSYGITRLNVYAGEAAGYMIRDEAEDALIESGAIPGDEDMLPLIIEDKSFVESETVRVTDPTWNWGTGPVDEMGVRTPVTGDLWYPHVYSPAQNPADPSGMNAFGRWHYGPWFWPPTEFISHPPTENPYYDPINKPWENETIPDMPSPSMVGEAFMDTPLVNGTAFPTVELDPKSYRLRILNAASDRFWNLQMYVADPDTESTDGRRDTEVKMVPAANTETYFPETWPTDARDGGVPDPRTAGPDWVQIATEGGFLPKPAVIPQQPITWNGDPTTFNFGNVDLHSLLLAPAERADVIVDFSKYEGQTLIVYNDAPAAFPARDARLDYYTGAPDLTDTGGHSGPQVGFGPNTRTIMQIKIKPAEEVTPAPAFDMAKLEAAFDSTDGTDGVFKTSQHPVIIPDARYDTAYNASFTPDPYVRIFQRNKRFKTVDGTTVTVPFEPKAIQDEMGEAFDAEYGRMSGKLGLQLPMPTNRQTFVLQNYTDPATEKVTAAMEPMSPVQGDGTQIWKITHNGVDTHPIHFHLFDVQLINRVGWDNGVRPPDDNELGWKDTVRVSPLEDTIVALRPILPKTPFGVPDSVRPLDPTMPIGSTMGFTSINPYTGEPLNPPVTNQMTNFEWEYVWHCHILSHEEMDMMRPMILTTSPSVPDTSVVGVSRTLEAATVTWTDPTDPADRATWGSMSGEVGYRVERATVAADGTVGGYTKLSDALANQTSYEDATVTSAASYRYRVVAYNAAGERTSLAVDSLPVAPDAPSGLTAVANSSTQVALSFTDNATFETGFVVERSRDGGAFSQVAAPAALSGTGTVTLTDTLPGPGTYEYRVKAVNGASSSLWSNTASVTPPLGASARLSGSNRYAVAVAIAQEAFPGWTGVTDVVIASGDEAAQADALAASGLSGAYGAPLLLVTAGGLPAETRNALNAMPAGVKVHVVGGTTSVPSSVYTSIDNLAKTGAVDRIAGASRYEVAANIAQRMKSVLGAAMPTTAIIANGADAGTYYDAIAASPIATKQKFPILLVSATSAPSATRNAISSLGLSQLYIVGGTSSVNETVRTTLSIPTANRISGPNRYATAVAVASKAKAMGWLDYRYVGVGATISDSLTGGTLLGHKNGVLLLTNTSVLSSETRNFLTTNKNGFMQVWVLGGTSSITSTVKTSIDGAIQ